MLIELQLFDKMESCTICKKLNQKPKRLLLKPLCFCSLVFVNHKLLWKLNTTPRKQYKSSLYLLKKTVFTYWPHSHYYPGFRPGGDTFWPSKATPAGGHICTMEPIWGEKAPSSIQGWHRVTTMSPLDGWEEGQKDAQNTQHLNLKDGFFSS